MHVIELEPDKIIMTALTMTTTATTMTMTMITTMGMMRTTTMMQTTTMTITKERDDYLVSGIKMKFLISGEFLRVSFSSVTKFVGLDGCLYRISD